MAIKKISLIPGRASKKAAEAKAATKKVAAKPAKTAPKKAATKPVAKPAAKKVVAKPVVKKVVAKPSAKPAAKTAKAEPKKVTSKPAVKPATKVAKPTATKKVVKPVAKPTKAKETVKPVKKIPATKGKVAEDHEFEGDEEDDLDPEVLVTEAVVDEIDAEIEEAPPEVEEDEERIVVPEGALILSHKDEDDIPVQTTSITGATADPVKDYLKQIGKVALLNAELEVELAKRIEAGLFAEEKLVTDKKLSRDMARDLK